MSSFKTVQEYTVSITTRNMLAAKMLSDKHNVGFHVRNIAVCPICNLDLTVAYTSYGPVYMCDSPTCKWNNKKDYPQCSKCGQEPVEPISVSNMCFVCDPDFSLLRAQAQLVIDTLEV